MIPLLGIILIDPTEIALRIYQPVEKNNWQVLFSNHYQIKVINAKYSDPLKILEPLADAFNEASEYGVGEWKICSRTIEPKINKELSQAINLNVEALSMGKEQDFIFKGILTDLIR